MRSVVLPIPLCRAAPAVAALWCAAASAASSNPTSTTALLRLNGAGEQVVSGDWVGTAQAPALNDSYRFFIEVPPGLSQLVVEVFDADVGRGGNGEGTRDLLTGRRFNTSVAYSLFAPSGAQVGGTVVCSNANTPAVCVDNAWSALFGTVQNPAAGHWELRIDPNNNGDETAGYGVRAHDGDPGAGGVEIPVYADSYLGLGPTTASQQVNTFHPWVTSGCTAASNDFDADGAAGTSYTLTGNVSFSQAFTNVSGNGVWRSNASAPFTSDNTAQNYGVWTAAADVRKAGGAAANVITYSVAGQFAAVAGSGNPPSPRNQPEPGAFRLYLPSDSGAAPAKPIVEQFVRAKGGPNPPAPGSTSTLTVTVRVRNPTSLPITFSATHTVTSTVPAGVSFAGALAATQGTATSPAVGVAGDVVWNPGVVIAGATALIAYDVDVTPASAGERIVVTGATAAGTTAQYVDETGNSTQGRATFTFGPLCELAVTAGLETYASVVDVAVERSPGGVDVSWRTAGEAGTLGFSVERVGADGERAPVGDLVPSPMHAEGHAYAVHDDDAAAFGAVAYVITEHDVRGNATAHGPYDVVDVRAVLPRGPSLAGGAPQWSGVSGAPQLAMMAAPAALPSAGAPLRARPPARLRVLVKDDGVVGVPLAQIALLLQRPLQRIVDDADHGHIAVESDGLAVPVDVRDGALVFMGRGSTSPFAAARTYFLSEAAGARAGVVDADPGVAPVTRRSARATAVRADDVFPGTSVDLDPNADVWFAASLAAGYAGYDHYETDVDAPGAVEAGAAPRLTLALQGATDAGRPDDHHVRVTVDGVAAGDVFFSGVARVERSLDLPADAVAGGHVHVAVDAVLDPGVSMNALFLDAVRVDYERTLTAAPRVFAGGAGDVVALAGAPASSWLYRVDGGRLLRLAGARVVDGALRARLPAAGVFALADGRARPALVVPAAGPALPLAAGGADVVVIAPHAFLDAAADLAAWHAERGLVSRVVDVQDVFDRYAAGDPDPRALRRFLAAAVARWSPAPRYAVFVGDGDVDYRDVQGRHEDFIPPLLQQTGGAGLAAADSLAGDVDGDGVPDVAVGRIPAHSAADVEGYLARARAFAGPASATFLADGPRDGAAFAAEAASLRQQVTVSSSLVSAGGASLDQTRAAVLDALAPSSLLTFVGHGGMDRIGNDGILMARDEDALAARGPWALLALTCLINRFELAPFPGLGEDLIRSGGAVVALAPTTKTSDALAGNFAAQLFARLSQGGTVGAVLVDAGRGYVDGGGDARLLGTEELLGDPTVPLASTGDSASCAQSGGAPLLAALALGLALLLRRRRR